MISITGAMAIGYDLLQRFAYHSGYAKMCRISPDRMGWLRTKFGSREG